MAGQSLNWSPPPDDHSHNRASAFAEALYFGRVKKIALFALPLALAACAPAQSQKPFRYQATPNEILAAIADIGPEVSPGAGTSTFAVKALSREQVTLQANGGVFGGLSVIVSVLESGPTTLVTYRYGAGDDVRPGSVVDNRVQEIFRKLSARYKLLP